MRRTPGSLVGIAVGATLLTAVLGMGLIFANAVNARRVAENARELHQANAVLGTAALLRAALVQAVTFSDLERSGLAEPGEVDAARAEARRAADRLGSLVADGYLLQAAMVLSALDQGRVDEARDLMTGDAESAYRELVGRYRSEQERVLAQIEANTDAASRIEDFVRFVLTLAIPGAAVLVYRYLARRAVREHQLQADLQVEAERAISRAKDDLIAGLSHELRTPLTSIYGFAELMGDADSETTKEMARIIATESAEMTRLVDDLLVAARLDSTGIEVRPEPVSVDDIVGSAAAVASRNGKDVERSGPSLTIETDPDRLRQVLVNLVSNAIRHGGPTVGVGTAESDGRVEIVVWDDGPGVPLERLDRLFGGFVNEGPEAVVRGSLGLGLAVAGRLTTLLGGELRYERTEDRSRFVVDLPRRAGADGDAK